MDLEAELAGIGDGGVETEALEAESSRAAGPYSERKGITYDAWRAAGAQPRVLNGRPSHSRPMGSALVHRLSRTGRYYSGLDSTGTVHKESTHACTTADAGEQQAVQGENVGNGRRRQGKAATA